MVHFQRFIVVLGPTASGKTRLAVELARRLNAEVISADSRQVYRDMNIGTGKDLDEYQTHAGAIRYHLIDIVEAGEQYNVFEFQQDFASAFADCWARHKSVVCCGGSGMYLDALLRGHQFTSIPIDETLRTQLQTFSDAQLLDLFASAIGPYTPLADTSTRKRLIRAIEINRYLIDHPGTPLPAPVALPQAYVFGIDLPAELRRQRITQRLSQRLSEGLVAEVEALLSKGIKAEQLIYYGLEYKFVTEYLLGHLPYDTMVERLNVAIHQFAKRQMTFFRKMQRDGLPIHWLDGRQPTHDLATVVLAALPQASDQLFSSQI